MKNTVFRLLFLCLVILLVFSSSLLASAKSLKVAMILWRGETRAESGFKDGLKELGYSAEYIIKNADQDIKKLGVLLSELKPKFDEFDYIYTPDDLAIGDSPVFPIRYHEGIYHGMATDQFIIEQSEKAFSYRDENIGLYNDYLTDMNYWNSTFSYV